MRMPDLKSINYEEEQVVHAAEPDGTARALNCSIKNKKPSAFMDSRELQLRLTENENCAGFSFKGYNDNRTFLNSHQKD